MTSSRSTSYSWQQRSSSTRFKFGAKFLPFETYWDFERHRIDEAQRQQTAASAKFPPARSRSRPRSPSRPRGRSVSPVTTHRGFPHRTPSARPAAPMPKKAPPPTPPVTLEMDGMTTSTTSLGELQFGERIIRDPTPLRGRRDSSERETSPHNELVRPKAPPTQLMHSNLEDAGEATRAKTQSPTTTTSPSMTNPLGSTTTFQLCWHRRCRCLRTVSSSTSSETSRSGRNFH